MQVERRIEGKERDEKQGSFPGRKENPPSLRWTKLRIPSVKKGTILFRDRRNTCSTKQDGVHEHHSSREAN